jgi:hypothetical protein
MSVYRRIADLIPSHGEGQLMTLMRHWCWCLCVAENSLLGAEGLDVDIGGETFAFGDSVIEVDTSW